MSESVSLEERTELWAMRSRILSSAIVLKLNHQPSDVEALAFVHLMRNTLDHEDAAVQGNRSGDVMMTRTDLQLLLASTCRSAILILESDA